MDSASDKILGGEHPGENWMGSACQTEDLNIQKLCLVTVYCFVSQLSFMVGGDRSNGVVPKLLLRPEAAFHQHQWVRQVVHNEECWDMCNSDQGSAVNHFKYVF